MYNFLMVMMPYKEDKKLYQYLPYVHLSTHFKKYIIQNGGIFEFMVSVDCKMFQLQQKFYLPQRSRVFTFLTFI